MSIPAFSANPTTVFQMLHHVTTSRLPSSVTKASSTGSIMIRHNKAAANAVAISDIVVNAPRQRNGLLQLDVLKRANRRNRAKRFLGHSVKNFRGFSAVTGINGFAFILDSQFWWEKVFWAILLGVCMLLTLRDVKLTMDVYMDEQTTNTISIVSADRLSVRDASLCIPVDLARFQPQHLPQRRTGNHSVPGDIQTPDLSVTLTQFQDELDLFLNRHGNDTLSSTRERCSGNLRTLRIIKLMEAFRPTLALLMELTEDKHSLVLLSDRRRSRRAEFVKQRAVNGTDSEDREVIETQEASRFYHEKGIQLDSLLRNVGALLCRFYSVEIAVVANQMPEEQAAHDKIFSLCHRGNVQFFGNIRLSGSSRQTDAPYLCLSLPNELLTFASVDDKVSIQIQPMSLSKAVPSVLLAQSNRFIYLSLHNGIDFLQNPSSSNFIRITPNAAIDVDVSLSSELKRYNSKSQPCSSQESLTQCQLACQLKTFVRTFGCFPLRHFALRSDKSVPICSRFATPSLATITLSALHKVLQARTQYCMGDCKEMCIQPIYSFAVSPLTVSSLDRTANNEPVTRIELHSTQFSRSLVIEQVPVMDLHTMLVTVGGNLGGSWLGISCAALVHVPVFLFRVLCYKLSKMNKHRKESRRISDVQKVPSISKLVFEKTNSVNSESVYGKPPCWKNESERHHRMSERKPKSSLTGCSKQTAAAGKTVKTRSVRSTIRPELTTRRPAWSWRDQSNTSISKHDPQNPIRDIYDSDRTYHKVEPQVAASSMREETIQMLLASLEFQSLLQQLVEGKSSASTCTCNSAHCCAEEMDE